MNKLVSILLLFVSLFCQIALQAEPLCHIRHYSTEDGIPQYNIMDMLQDDKGYIWLATWDGLSKFDGYEFKNYKARSANKYFMRSNRIEKLSKDKYGRIWLKSYDNDFHCFDPRTESFWGIQSIKNMSKNKIAKIFIQPSGKIWLIIDSNGCILLKDSTFVLDTYNTKNENLISNKINNIIEDTNKNTWILTDNGIEFIADNGKSKQYFTEKTGESDNGQEFFTGVELENEIWFGSENGRIWRITKTGGKSRLLQLSFHSNITHFIKISENQLGIFSDSEGFAVVNLKDNSTRFFNSKNLTGLSSNHIVPVCVDKAQNLWFETNELGINRLNPETGDYKNYKVSTVDVMGFVAPPLSFVIEDVNGRLWIQPKGGGFSLYDKEKDILKPFFNSPMSENWLFSNSLHSAFSDKQGNLWLGTHSHGLEKVIFDMSFFTTTRISNQKYLQTANEVRAVFEDDDSNLWVSTKDRKLTVFDKNKKRLGEIGVDGNLHANSLMPATVYCITKDKDNNIWIGTKGAGVFLLKKTALPLRFLVTQYKNIPTDVYSLSDNSVYSIFQDNKSNIWIGTYGGGLNLLSSKAGTTQFINHRNHLENYPIETASQVRYITQNKQGNICLGTTGGMLMFASGFSSPENIHFKRYSLEPNEKKSITNNDVHGVCVTKKGEMYLFTFGGGINKVVNFDSKGFPTEFETYNTENGLESDVTLSIIEDEFGKLWVSTENSLNRFDPENGTFRTFSEIRKIMTNSYFSEFSACKTQNDEIIFGYSDGLLSFSPKNISDNGFKPYIALTNFQLFNKNVSIGEKSPLHEVIDNISKLKLTHKQKFFNIQYAALDLIDPENIQYAYKLEGVDKEWNYVRNQRIAYYTNIPKGKYIFKVKSTNSDGYWTNNERLLPIEVLPSFWESFVATILYILLIIGLIYLIVRTSLTFYRLKANVELEKKMSDLKLRFFTDVSHEIRTPLTMIAGPVDYLIQDIKTPESVKNQLKIVSQSTNRMLRLVNQILDLRKIQSVNLKVQEIHLADFVSNLCSNFTEIAEKQNVQFNFQDESQNGTVWVDPDSAEKIIVNLLSNAFKYTPSGKSIQVVVKNEGNTLSVIVKDEGVGISKEKQKKLFNRFESFSEDKSKPSTGIGLNLIKELADKHTAKVAVESEEKMGSTFTVSFQKGLTHFDKSVEIIAASKKNEDYKDTVQDALPENDIETIVHTKKEKHTILIVEDEEDLRTFIRTILEEDYKVYEAEDGADGMKKALKICPDFIVSDIMMPNVDGIEFLHSLRKEKSTSHIPVILLTAKSTIETKLEGLEYGADDYITKPFSVTYFRARIANLLRQRENLQKIYRDSLIPFGGKQESIKPETRINEFQPQPVHIASQDETMMKKVMELIEKNMDNYDFSVEEISKYVGMSRSVFFKKLKSLTGFSPIEFVRDIKMKRAAQLLSTGELMVKEVASMVGILDTRYFSKCFKTKYGTIPQDYKSQSTGENL
ncbi:MAG: two-component regulator propeller domain-containing protein [Paludibacteraceae bacterium]